MATLHLISQKAICKGTPRGQGVDPRTLRRTRRNCSERKHLMGSIPFFPRILSKSGGASALTGLQTPRGRRSRPLWCQAAGFLKTRAQEARTARMDPHVFIGFVRLRVALSLAKSSSPEHKAFNGVVNQLPKIAKLGNRTLTKVCKSTHCQISAPNTRSHLSPS